jgi:hypothetical protein
MEFLFYHFGRCITGVGYHVHTITLKYSTTFVYLSTVTYAANMLLHAEQHAMTTNAL